LRVRILIRRTVRCRPIGWLLPPNAAGEYTAVSMDAKLDLPFDHFGRNSTLHGTTGMHGAADTARHKQSGDSTCAVMPLLFPRPGGWPGFLRGAGWSGPRWVKSGGDEDASESAGHVGGGWPGLGGIRGRAGTTAMFFPRPPEEGVIDRDRHQLPGGQHWPQHAPLHDAIVKVLAGKDNLRIPIGVLTARWSPVGIRPRRTPGCPWAARKHGPLAS
jgi:hypothetical protein